MKTAEFLIFLVSLQRKWLLMQDLKTISTYKASLRERILETAMKAFSEKGIRAVRMDDIAQQLSISKRTLYELYENKEILLFEGVQKYKRTREQQMSELVRNSENAMDLMLNIYRSKVEEFKKTSPLFYSDIEKYPSVVALFDADSSQSRERFCDFLRRGMREGFFRSDIDMELVPSMFDTIMKLIMEQQLYLRFSIEELFRNLVFVAFRGICTRRGSDILDTFLI